MSHRVTIWRPDAGRFEGPRYPESRAMLLIELVRLGLLVAKGEDIDARIAYHRGGRD